MLETEDRVSFVSKSGVVLKNVNNYVLINNTYLDLEASLKEIQKRVDRNLNNK